MTSHRRGRLRAVISLAGVLALLFVTAPDAGAATEVVEVEGSAFALFVQGEIPDPVPSPPAGGGLSSSNGEATPQATLAFGPAPVVELPPQGGGPLTDSFLNVNLESGLLTAGVGEVSTQGSLGANGTVTSQASVADLDLDRGDATADLISAECSSGIGGPTGSMSIVNGQIEGVPLPASFPPNTVLDLGPFGSATVNRQVVDGNHIEVTAIAAEVTSFEFTGTVEIAQVVCGVTTAEIPEDVGPVTAEPSFTG